MNHEWERLEARMLRTGMFHSPRLTSRFLAKNFFTDQAVVRVRSVLVGGMEYCAYITWLATKDPMYCEIALAYVAEDLEGNGILKEILADLLKKLPRTPIQGKSSEEWPQAIPFFFTKSPAMMSVVLRFGFQPVTKAIMLDVEEWAAKVGCSDRLPESALRTTLPSPKGGERWLFVRF